MLFPPCLIEHVPLSPIKDNLTKENARIKQVFRQNGYQEDIINKIFNRTTKNNSLSQSQQQTQATDILEKEIRMRINLPHARSIYIEGTKTKLYIFIVVYLEEKVGGKRTKSSRRSLCIKHRDSFLKNKFAMLSDFVESGFNLVISCVFQ